MSAERKFEDRDVRDNPAWYPVVIDYLRQYTGEFGFLIDMKMREAAGSDLSVGHVRGVLNCMRNDPRVNLPEVPPKVKKSKGKKGKKKRHLAAVVPLKPEPLTCDLIGSEDHDGHWLEEGDRREWCTGWHKINRQRQITRRARFHSPFLRGRSSNLIHRSTHVGEVVWSNPAHRMGPGYIWAWYVKAVCPVTLKQPSLLDKQGVRAAENYDIKNTAHTHVTLCSRCFPEGDTE